MTVSYNGWPASPSATAVHAGPFIVAGASFPGGVRTGDVATVLSHVATQFHFRVEPLHSPGCWGFSYRKNRNADNLSCHASATAIDCNAPKHPNGVAARKTFSLKQIDEIHKILAEVDNVVVWGGDFHGTPDAMHFEIHGDAEQVARVAKMLRGGAVSGKKTRGPNVDKAIVELKALIPVIQAIQGRPVRKAAALSAVNTALTALKQIPLK